MFERPDLSDDRLIACLHEVYGLRIGTLDFLPLGADVDTVVYRATSVDNVPASYFVKLRRGAFDGSTVRIQRYLHDGGIAQIIPPMATVAGELGTRVAARTVILYPFVAGKSGFDQPLSDQQWIAFGSALRQLHAERLPHDLRASLPCETYAPIWREMVMTFQARVEREAFSDRVAAECAAILRDNRDTVTRLVDRAGQLAELLKVRSLDNVLCHADIHAGNVLIDERDDLYIVDWDTLVLAPKERDLMFVGAGIGGIWNSEREAALFYQGYGETVPDPLALGYYRHERNVEDIAAFCQELLTTGDGDGGDDREQSLRHFASLFRPGSVIEAAFQSDRRGA